MKTTIGIIGAAGTRGHELFNLFSQIDDRANVTAVTDLNQKKLSELHPEPSSVNICRSTKELVLSQNIDAVVIATPDHLHEEHTLLALNAGKHVFLEKPLATNPDSCDRIIHKAKKCKRTLYVGHNLRHFTVIKKLKELVEAEAVGVIKAIWCQHFINYGKWAYFKNERWHKKREISGSLLIHKGCHDLDVIHWLSGSRTKEVTAVGGLVMYGNEPGQPDVEDVSSVLLKLENGVQATYNQCHFAHLSGREYTILGSKGTLRNIGDNPANAVIQLHKKQKGLLQVQAAPEEWRFEAEEGFHGAADQRTVREFIEILSGNNSGIISLESAAWAVKTAWAATYSLRNGSIPVPVS